MSLIICEDELEAQKARELIEKIDDLPLLDGSAYEIIETLKDSLSSFDEVRKKLTPSVVAKFMQTAKLLNPSIEIHSVEHAIRVLGFNGMHKVLESANIVDELMVEVKGREFDFQKFYKQSRTCSSVARLIGESVGYAGTEELFTAAMLHNIGKVVLAAYFDSEYSQIEETILKEGCSESEAEKKVFGMDHAEIGAAILEKFCIPLKLCDAVRFHNLNGAKVSEGSGYELQLIIQSSARITHMFLNNEIDKDVDVYMKLHPLKCAWEKEYRGWLRTEAIGQGYAIFFPSLLARLEAKMHSDIEGLFHLNEGDRSK